jgi:hypothetical protein
MTRLEFSQNLNGVPTGPVPVNTDHDFDAVSIGQEYVEERLQRLDRWSRSKGGHDM